MGKPITAERLAAERDTGFIEGALAIALDLGLGSKEAVIDVCLSEGIDAAALREHFADDPEALALIPAEE